MNERVRLIAYDFDGVMTNNRVLVSSDGTEQVMCHRDDGLGVVLLMQAGVDQIIISNEPNHVVSVRANKVGIPAMHGVDDKCQTLVNYCGKRGIALHRVCYVGNEINDVDVMGVVGLPVCVGDAGAACVAAAKHRLARHGGEGVVLELYEWLSDEGWLQR